MPNWDDENGRFWFKPPGNTFPVEIPHAPITLHDDCLCEFCWSKMGPKARAKAEAKLKPKPNPQHSSAHASWGTPTEFVEFSRSVLDRIDLDPFSSAAWNQIVKAKRFFNEEQNGFGTSWGNLDSYLTALVNVPGDPRGANVKEAWELTTSYYYDGTVGGGVIWIAFSIHQFQTLQNARVSILSHDYLRLVPRRRIDYQKVPGVSGGAPTHPSALVLLPSRRSEDEADDQRNRFMELGAAFGGVI